MLEPTEKELHQIIQRVMQRTLGDLSTTAVVPNSTVKDTTESKPVQAVHCTGPQTGND